MRILFVNTYYYPNMFGGAEHSVKLLAEGLSSHHECAVFTVDAATDGLTVEKINGVVVYRSGSSRFNYKARFSKTETKFVKLKNRFADLYNPEALKHFNQVLDQFRPEVVHSNGIRGMGPHIWRAAKKKNIKVVHTLRDYFVVDPTMKMNRLSLFWGWKAYFSHYSKYIDCLTAPSNYTLENVLNVGFCSCVKNKKAIPNATDVNEHELEALIDSKCQTSSTLTRFIFVGTLGEYKGVLNLLAAFDQMREKNAELVICGSGVLKEKVENASRKNKKIIYRGQLSKDDLKKEYQKSDVCVIPSLWDEPFGRVVVEAAAYGCAIIASNRGGIPEIIKVLDAGNIIDCANIQLLRNTLDLLCDINVRKSQLYNIRKNVYHFSIENNVKSYETTYSEILYH